MYNKGLVPVLKILVYKKVFQEDIKMRRKVFSIIITGVLLSSLALGYSGGSGTAENPYQIVDANDLLALAGTPTDYNKCFILMADVNLQGQVFTKAIIAADTSSDYGFQGTAFTGMFDGNSHKITHFTINGGSNCYLGLFGYIGSGGSIKNLGLENFTVSGSSGSYDVGGLVGFNGGSISDCYSTGSVSGSSDSSAVGGLVGSNGGSINNCYSTGTVSGYEYVGGLVGTNGGSINNCYSTATVSGGSNSQYVGGLVGENRYSSHISGCYSTGSVSGNMYIGGLVGSDDYSGSITDCYSTGAVSGTSGVGGLVGEENSGSIGNCYSTGVVSGTSVIGGLVGYNYLGSVNSSFWDTLTSGRMTSAGGTGKTTAEMKTLSTFTSAGWDFVEIWGIEKNQTYPYLRTEPAGDLNYDKKVNFADFAILASHWLEGT